MRRTTSSPTGSRTSRSPTSRRRSERSASSTGSCRAGSAAPPRAPSPWSRIRPARASPSSSPPSARRSRPSHGRARAAGPGSGPRDPQGGGTRDRGGQSGRGRPGGRRGGRLAAEPPHDDHDPRDHQRQGPELHGHGDGGAGVLGRAPQGPEQDRRPEEQDERPQQGVAVHGGLEPGLPHAVRDPGLRGRRLDPEVPVQVVQLALELPEPEEDLPIAAHAASLTAEYDPPPVDFELSDEQRNIRRLIHDFAEAEVKPVAEELDREKRFPYEIVEALGELGLMGTPYPEEYGGGGADTRTYAIAV